MTTKFFRPRGTLAAEVVLFALASCAHAGVLLRGYEHYKAASAEGIIAFVLTVGLVGCFIRPGSARAVAMATQSFALLGTILGAFLIAIGVGPRTPADIMLHVVMLGMLTYGLATAVTARPAERGR